MQAALAPRLVRNMSDDWEEKNAKMESCQSKDDKCGGKVEQIFSSEKEQKEQSAGTLGWFCLLKNAKSNVWNLSNQPQPQRPIDMSTVHHVDVVRFNHI